MFKLFSMFLFIFGFLFLFYLALKEKDKKLVFVFLIEDALLATLFVWMIFDFIGVKVG